MAELDGIRLESTTDTPEQVNEALGIEQTQEAETPAEPEPTAEPEQEAAETDDTTSEPPAAAAEAEPTPDDEADESEESEPGEGEAPKDETQPRRPRRRRDYQRRINELVAARNQEREAREALERRLAALEQRGQPAPDAEPEPEAERTAPVDGKPNPEAFDNYDDYVDALTQWRAEQIVDQREQARAEREREAAAAREQEERSRTWTGKVDAARQKYNDWDDIFEGETIRVAQPIAMFLEESEVGADLLRHLYLEPDVMERLSGQSVIQVARELGRIEAEYLNGNGTQTAEPEPSPTPTETTEPEPAAAAPPARARPAPINPVTQATSTTPKDPDQMDYEEFVKWREKGGGR